MLCFVDGMMGYLAHVGVLLKDFGEVVGDYGDQPEGVRVKHLAFGNSLKVCDKGGSILRIASRVSYRLRILRAHGLIRKSPNQRRYHVTTKGRDIVTALCRSQHTTLQQLNTTAA
jgi:hypothetical protein